MKERSADLITETTASIDLAMNHVLRVLDLQSVIDACVKERFDVPEDARIVSIEDVTSPLQSLMTAALRELLPATA